jgi:outer membrane protein assembly factor BamB
MRACCGSFSTGKAGLVLKIVVATPEKTAQVHRKNSLASPTPILSQDRVYVHFGPYCTACLSTAGEIL